MESNLREIEHPDSRVLMNYKLLIKLLLLLAITIIIGQIVVGKEHGLREFNEKEFSIEESNDFVVLDNMYILAHSNPIYTDSRVLGTKLSKGGYMELLQQYNWDSNIAYAVMMAESGGNPDNINKEDYHRRAKCWGSYGLFQMGCVHFGSYGLTSSNWNDPVVNVKAAYLLWKERGWTEWGAYKNKSYLKFL